MNHQFMVLNRINDPVHALANPVEFGACVRVGGDGR